MQVIVVDGSIEKLLDACALFTIDGNRFSVHHVIYATHILMEFAPIIEEAEAKTAQEDEARVEAKVYLPKVTQS